MPSLPVRQFTAWSFSRWKDWAECPLKARLKHLDKLPEGPKGPALIRGEQIHKLAEDYTKGLIARLPKELKLFSKEFAVLRKAKAVAEGKWAMTVQWKPTEFNNWTHAWCRVVLDAHYQPKPRVTDVIDHKTGRIYPDNRDQMELYAIAGFAHYADTETVNTRLWYLDQGVEKAEKFTRKQVVVLQKKWREKVIPMLSDKKFIPRPGEQCARCAYSIRRGGPCKF